MTGRWAGRIAYRLRRRTPTPSPAPFLDGALVAAGGWCAPSATIYDAASLDTNDFTLTFGLADAFPVLTVLRHGTPEWHANQRRVEDLRKTEASLQQMIDRHIGDVRTAQDAALTRVYRTAEVYGLDVLVQDPPRGHSMWRWSGNYGHAYRFVGLALIPRAKTHERQLQGWRPVIIHETAPDYDPEDNW